MPFISIVAFFLLVFGIIVVVNTLIKVTPYEKGVKERLSKYVGTLDQGWHMVVPFIETVNKVDMREKVLNTPAHEMITKDNASVVVDAVIYTQIQNPKSSVYEIDNPFNAVTNLAITSLRSIIGTMTLDEVLGERSKINAKTQTELIHETNKWGISINKIEISRLDPPADIQNSMSKQMKAEREKRAQILEAEGMKEAAIRNAEGEKEAAIRRAEGVQQQQILEADGQAQAIERIAGAKAKALELEATAAMTYFKDNAVLKEQLQVLENAMKNNSKYVIDLDIFKIMKNLMDKK